MPLPAAPRLESLSCRWVCSLFDQRRWTAWHRDTARSALLGGHVAVALSYFVVWSLGVFLQQFSEGFLPASGFPFSRVPFRCFMSPPGCSEWWRFLYRGGFFPSLRCTGGMSAGPPEKIQCSSMRSVVALRTMIVTLFETQASSDKSRWYAVAIGCFTCICRYTRCFR